MSKKVNFFKLPFILVTILAACILFEKPLKFVYVYERCEGIYKNSQAVKHSTGKRSYDIIAHPVIMFKTADGQEHEFCSSLTYKDIRPFSFGDTVPVIFNPANPVTAEINSIKAIWFRPTALFILVELFMFAVGIRKY